MFRILRAPISNVFKAFGKGFPHEEKGKGREKGKKKGKRKEKIQKKEKGEMVGIKRKVR